MHDGGLAKGQPEGAEGHVAVQEAALVDEAQDLRLGHRLLGPACNTKTHASHPRSLQTNTPRAGLQRQPKNTTMLSFFEWS